MYVYENNCGLAIINIIDLITLFVGVLSETLLKCDQRHFTDKLPQYIQ